MKKLRIFIQVFLFCFLIISIVVAASTEFVGKISNVKDENHISVKVIDSNGTKLYGTVEVLLPQSINKTVLTYLSGKNLRFNIIGHDINKRLVCNVFYKGSNINLYSSWQFFCAILSHEEKIANGCIGPSE